MLNKQKMKLSSHLGTSWLRQRYPEMAFEVPLLVLTPWVIPSSTM